VKRFSILFDVRHSLRKMNREAAIDSLRNVLAVLGLGVLIGDFATMHLMYALPGALLLIAVWYADYLRHDLPNTSVVELPVKQQPLHDPTRQLTSAS
jgi:hypothetical protein